MSDTPHSSLKSGYRFGLDQLKMADHLEAMATAIRAGDVILDAVSLTDDLSGDDWYQNSITIDFKYRVEDDQDTVG